MATKTKRTTLSIGSVSSGTMRTEDLIPSLLWEVKKLRLSRSERASVRDIEKCMQADDYYETDDADYDLNETLFDILNNHCPAYFYFGSHPGDGADYGVWLSESFEDDFTGLKVNDLADVPRDYFGEILHVNDHGNMTLYVRQGNGRIREIWGLV